MGLTFSSAATNPNTIFVLDVEGQDDVFVYDYGNGFHRSNLFTNIISIYNGGKYNAGRGDLAAQIQPPIPTNIVSTFDTDADGWTAELLSSTNHNNPPINKGPAPLYDYTSGGNPGGYIGSFDIDDVTEPHFVAPAKYLGNKSAYFGGVISFDIKDNLYPTEGNYDEVELIGNGHTLFYDNWSPNFIPYPANTWTNWVIPLAPAPGWRLDSYDTNAPLATAADFLLVLSNLQELNVSIDLASGDDYGCMDNFRLAPAVAAQILSPHCNRTNVVFNLATVNGQSYTVQQNTNLASTNWIACTNFIGNGLVFQFTNPAAGLPRNFYRITTP